MEQVGINSNVYAGGKIFHIQTAGNRAGLTLRAEIFDSGRVITVHQKKLDEQQFKNIDEAQFREFLSGFHQEIAWEIELLFFIRDRVKTIKHAISNNKMGMLFLRRGLIEEAIAEFEQAIAINPELVESYKNLGLAHLQKQDFDEAVKILRKAVEYESQYADLRNHLGAALIKAGRYDEALTEFEAALGINANYLEAMLNIDATILRMHMDQYKSEKYAPSLLKLSRVVTDLQKIMTTHPDIANFRYYTFRFDKAIKQITNNELTQALETLDEIKDGTRKPNLDETIHGFYLKFLFGGAGKDEKVLADYRNRLEKSLTENPNYADLHNSLGVVYLIQCRNLFIRAMTEFKKAYEINPSYKNAYKNFRLVQNDGREFLNLLRAILK